MQTVLQPTQDRAGTQRGTLPGQRLHLHEGPIDLVIGAEGDASAIRAAYTTASNRFDGLLTELVSELPLLRQPLDPEGAPLNGTIARRMARAVSVHDTMFVTPMAAVAGAVADEILAAMTEVSGLDKAYVNNGGDIAFHLAPGERFKIGAVSDVEAILPDGFVTIPAETGIRGVATSGAGGRSFSLGIADAVTVLAVNAATADVAATLIANEVNVDHPAIDREPAHDLDPDSDLGDRLVTTSVGELPTHAVAQALDTGAACAETMRRRGTIHGALLRCQDQVRVVADDRFLTER